MEKQELINKVEILKDISKKYEIENLSLGQLITDINTFKVTVPVVGGFSSGKSSLINALLGNRILATAIEAKTAIPTEVFYGDNSIYKVKKDGKSEKISLEDLKNNKFSIDEIEVIKVEQDNAFLKSIKDVKIVDMPGFDSGISLHDKAIDNYLPSSLAYIITFEVGENIRESIVNFLIELNLHELPVLIVITKCDKATQSDIDETIKFMKENIPKYIINKQVKIVTSKSKRDIDVSGVKEFLLNIQTKSSFIMENKYRTIIKQRCNIVNQYLESRIKKADLDKVEIIEEENKLKKQLEELESKVIKEKEKFEIQANKSIEVINHNIETSLINSQSIIENMLLNGQDITHKINLIVRNSIITSIKNEFEPKLQKYLKQVSEIINVGDDLDSNIEIDKYDIELDNMVKDIIQKSIPAILAVIGGSLAGPLGAIIAAALGVVVDVIFNRKQKEDKKRLVYQKVNDEIIPQVVQEAGSAVSKEILMRIDLINEEIKTSINREKQIKIKAFEDLKKQNENKEVSRKEEIENLKKDLKIIERLRNGI